MTVLKEINNESCGMGFIHIRISYDRDMTISEADGVSLADGQGASLPCLFDSKSSMGVPVDLP